MSRSCVRIANGQGFWGDSVDAPVRLIEEGPTYAERAAKIGAAALLACLPATKGPDEIG